MHEGFQLARFLPRSTATSLSSNLVRMEAPAIVVVEWLALNNGVHAVPPASNPLLCLYISPFPN